MEETMKNLLNKINIALTGITNGSSPSSDVKTSIAVLNLTKAYAEMVNLGMEMEAYVNNDNGLR